MANHYVVPNWAGKPPTGLHLDVMKEDKLIQKLMVDEKKCYLFGRIPQLNDFVINHASASRVHAAFVYHKHLNITYLVDLGSTHGSFIGSIRLESHKPTKLQINSTFHFGASTRRYILRERPSGARSGSIMEDIPMIESSDGTIHGLPENQTELDNLTEYNTAHNRRITLLGISDNDDVKRVGASNKNKRKRRSVTFNEDEIVINPEDIDPAVGRFRNLIQTTVIPAKKMKMDSGSITISAKTSSELLKHNHVGSNTLLAHSLYDDLPPTSDGSASRNSLENDPMKSVGSKLGLILPNPAPTVDLPSTSAILPPIQTTPSKLDDQIMDTGDEPKKKKYAKEAWPGRAPLLSSF